MTCGELLWVKVIKVVYGVKGGFKLGTCTNRGYAPWARIVASCKQLEDKDVVPTSMLNRILGNESNIQFSNDL